MHYLGSKTDLPSTQDDCTTFVIEKSPILLAGIRQRTQTKCQNNLFNSHTNTDTCAHVFGESVCVREWVLEMCQQR